MTQTEQLANTAPHMNHAAIVDANGVLVAIACQPHRALPKRAKLVPAAGNGMTCLRCSGGVIRFR